MDDEDAIEAAYEAALERWLRSARGIYGRQYENLRIQQNDLSVDIDGRSATGDVVWSATVFNKQLERDESASGVIDVRFAQFGCNWRLVEFDY